MMTPVKLNRKGFKALIDTLGYADAIRFIQQFDNCSGNYTKERRQWLDKVSIDDFFSKMQKHKKSDDRGNFEEIIE
jgi:hypothetical protein